MERLDRTHQRTKNVTLSALPTLLPNQREKLLETRDVPGPRPKDGRQSVLPCRPEIGFSQDREVPRDPGFDWKRPRDPREKTVDRPHAQPAHLPNQPPQHLAASLRVQLPHTRRVPQILELLRLHRRPCDPLERGVEELPGRLRRERQRRNPSRLHVQRKQLHHPRRQRIRLPAACVRNQHLMRNPANHSSPPLRNSTVSASKQFSSFPLRNSDSTGSPQFPRTSRGGQKTPFATCSATASAQRSAER